MQQQIKARPLTRQNFADYGEIIDKQGAQKLTINNGNCIRHHALAKVDKKGGQTLINIFSGTPYEMPHRLEMVERHPLGSQAFMPLQNKPFLVIVCRDENGMPQTPEVFITTKGQGVNIYRNVWHGVLTPLEMPADFLVVDRGGKGNNLEEYYFDEPYIIMLD